MKNYGICSSCQFHHKLTEEEIRESVRKMAQTGTPLACIKSFQELTQYSCLNNEAMEPWGEWPERFAEDLEKGKCLYYAGGKENDGN